MNQHSGDLGGLGGGHEAASPRDRPEGLEGSFTLQLPAFYFEPYSVWNTGLPTSLVLKYLFVIQYLSFSVFDTKFAALLFTGYFRVSCMCVWVLISLDILGSLAGGLKSLHIMETCVWGLGCLSMGQVQLAEILRFVKFAGWGRLKDWGRSPNRDA